MDISPGKINRIAEHSPSQGALSKKEEYDHEDMKSHLFEDEEKIERRAMEGQAGFLAVEDDKEQKKRKKLEKKLTEGAESRAAVDEGATPEELLLARSQVAADAKLKLHQSVPKGLQQQVQEEVEQYFKREYSQKSDDTVVLTRDKHDPKLPPELQRLLLEKAQQQSQQMGTEAAIKKSFTQEEMSRGARSEATTTQASVIQKKEQTKEKSTEETQRENTIKYLGVLAESIVSQTQQTKDKARILKEGLMSEGISTRKLNDLEKTVRQTIRNDIKKQLKDSFIKLAMDFENKLDLTTLTNSHEMNSLAQMAGLKGVFGPGQRSLQEIKGEAKEEMQAFVASELDNALVESKLRGDSLQELIKGFDRFNHIANIAKFDKPAYFKTLQKKIEDWGLENFKSPEKLGIIDNEPRSGQSRGGGSGRHPHDSPQQEALADEIRALCLQKCVRHDFRSAIEIRFKINSLKKKLNDADLFKTLEDEGEALAKLRLVDMFKEALEEKASIADQKSAAFQITQKKLKLAMKGLKNLGCSLPKKDMIAIRDQVNITMFSIIKEEYLKMKVAIEASPTDINLNRRKKEFLIILERLKKESHIKENIEVTQTTVFSSNTSIIEAA